MNYLLHPELVRTVPIVGSSTEHALNQRAAEAAADDPALDPPISVVIRTRNEAPKLKLLLQDISKQIVGNAVELIIVDNESTDNTTDIAREYGAKLVTLPREEFTYPRSMNLGMQAASHDAVFMTVAHAQLSSTQLLHAGAHHMRPGSNVGGVFSVMLPSPEASLTERCLYIHFGRQLAKQPRRITKATIGDMAATGAFFSKQVWEELGGFDERYQTGGEDTAHARTMLERGYEIVKEPALAVHHAHGHGFIDTVKDTAHFIKTVKAPQLLQGDIAARRKARFKDSTDQ